MIVPRSKLIFWTGFVAMPFAVLATTVPSTAPLSLGAIALLVAVATLDAVLAHGRLEGVSARLDPLVRLTKDRPGALGVQINNAGMKVRTVRVGIAFPKVFDAPTDLAASLPHETESSHLAWPCTPASRGNFFLDGVYFETDSPLGLWSIRAKRSARAELRVYPNLLRERKRLAALFLNRGAFGIHAQRQVGKGREFEKLREYLPGDDYDELHWKATAKRGRPITKVFQIERTQEVYVIIDTSRLSARESRHVGDAEHVRETFVERFMTAALLLGLAAQRQGDLFGVAAFSDRVERFVRARNGAAHYGFCRDALYTLEAGGVNPDFAETAAFLRGRLRRRALLLFLTNLDDPVLAESFVRAMDLLRDQHLVLANMPMPEGVAPLFSSSTMPGVPEVNSVDGIYEQLGGHIRWQSLRELEGTLRKRGVAFSLLDHERLCAQVIAQYLSVKQRQLL